MVEKVPHAGGILKNYVAGEFVAGDQTFPNINPVDGSEINQVAGNWDLWIGAPGGWMLVCCGRSQVGVRVTRGRVPASR